MKIWTETSLTAEAELSDAPALVIIPNHDLHRAEASLCDKAERFLLLAKILKHRYRLF